MVLPTAYGRIGDTLYLHGSSANRSILAADGQQVCVTVTHVDGLVCARAVFSHSVNYRSAVVFGVARLVTDDAERLAGLRAVTEQLIPGRWEAVRAAHAQGTRRHRRARRPAGGGLGQGPHRPARRRAGGPVAPASGPGWCPPP